MNSSIITGLGKTNQVLKEPYLSYYSQIDRLVHESDAVMFIGYGFGDLHLNAAFPFIRYDKNKKRKVVIIDFAENDADGIGFRHDEWQFGLFATIPYNGHEMGNGKNLLPQCANYFKKSNTLEKSSNPEYPLAIWYNGLLAACDYPNKILEELL